MTLNLVGASILELQDALSNGSITSVELVAKYLIRILTYDCRGPCLNSIPILNPDVFDEAAASDIRRRAGRSRGPLDGIPYTLKDSMKYAGMTCATGSPAIKDLVANEDSFVAEQLRKAGAVCIGRTNTPPFMASGLHRGLYGRAESPYNHEYLTAAFSSGSSNGSGTSTAASFAAFGLGSETVSSGRSPASNNALVAYTPSRCVISPRGIWPLYPTCDVLVPHTRTVRDMLAILDVLTQEDPRVDGDFWREQDFVQIPKVPRPMTFLEVVNAAEGCLQGKRIAVPKMYIGGHDPKAKPSAVSTEVIELYKQAKKELETMGAEVIETEFPLVTNYEDDSISGETNNVVGFKPGWNAKERGELVAYSWDDFLKSNGDPKYPGLPSVDGTQMFPRPEGYIPDRYMEHKNFMNYPGLVEIARQRNGKTIWEVDGIKEALPSLEAQRKRDFEDWMDENVIDVVAFPANGDVGKADLETNDESARHALQIGVKYSNGNRAIRHMGVPTVSVCMGLLATSRMPVNLTFAGRHGQDIELLKFAYAFEQFTKHRVEPPLTPALASDIVDVGERSRASSSPSNPPEIEISNLTKIRESAIRISGRIAAESPENARLEAFVNGERAPGSGISSSQNQWTIEADFIPYHAPKPSFGGLGLTFDKITVLVLLHADGSVVGKVAMLPQDAPLKE